MFSHAKFSKKSPPLETCSFAFLNEASNLETSSFASFREAFSPLYYWDPLISRLPSVAIHFILKLVLSTTFIPTILSTLQFLNDNDMLGIFFFVFFAASFPNRQNQLAPR